MSDLFIYTYAVRKAQSRGNNARDVIVWSFDIFFLRNRAWERRRFRIIIYIYHKPICANTQRKKCYIVETRLAVWTIIHTVIWDNVVFACKCFNSRFSQVRFHNGCTHIAKIPHSFDMQCSCYLHLREHVAFYFTYALNHTKID